MVTGRIMTRLVAVCAGVALAGAGLAGCGGSGHRAASGASPTPSLGASGSARLGVGGGPGTEPSGTASAGPGDAGRSAGPGQGGPGGAGGQACSANALSLAQLPGQDGAAGTIVVKIRITNVSGRACVLGGYPNFRLTAPSASMGTDVNETISLVDGGLGGPFATPPASLTLAPNGTAGFLVAYSNRTGTGAGGCDLASKLHLMLPGQSVAVVGPVQIQVCVPTMHVSAFLPGSQL
jgi:hypothetical protein